MITLNLLKCRCGCGEFPTTNTGWKWGHFNKGKKKPPRTDQHRARLSAARMGKGQMFGPANPMWGKPSPHRNPDREAQALKTKIAKMHRHMLGRIRKKFSTRNEGRTFEILGYSAQQLREHLESLFESGMSWSNHGNGPGKWNLDHIVPICKFPTSSTPAEVNALSNLRPLWWEQNMARLRKGAS